VGVRERAEGGTPLTDGVRRRWREPRKRLISFAASLENETTKHHRRHSFPSAPMVKHRKGGKAAPAKAAVSDTKDPDAELDVDEVRRHSRENTLLEPNVVSPSSHRRAAFSTFCSLFFLFLFRRPSSRRATHAPPGKRA
jgi:hypothetical protein